MKYCLRCAREIGEGHETCPFCGTPQKELRKQHMHLPEEKSSAKVYICAGIVGFLILLLVLAVIIEKNSFTFNSKSKPIQAEVLMQSKTPVTSISAKQILSEYKNNEIRAGEMFNGKRIEISGCVANIDNTLGILSVYINSCGGPLDVIDFVHAIFPEKEKKNLSMLNKGQKISVICTINDGGNIMGVQGDNCLIK
jgi:hypothetical protein